jgi:hypothetical protein
MLLKAWLKNLVLECAPNKVAAGRNTDCWPALLNTGLIWFGRMGIHPNLVRATSLVSGTRPGINFRAMDGCRDRDVSEILSWSPLPKQAVSLADYALIS